MKIEKGANLARGVTVSAAVLHANNDPPNLDLPLQRSAVGVADMANFSGTKDGFELVPLTIRGVLGPRAHCCPSSTTTTSGEPWQHGITTSIFEKDDQAGVATANLSGSFAGWLLSSLWLNVLTTLSVAIGSIPFLVCFALWMPELKTGTLSDAPSVLVSTLRSLQCVKTYHML